QVARQIDAFLFAAETGDAVRVFNLGLNGRHTDDLVVQDHCKLIADVGFGVAPEPPAAILGEAEIGFPLAEFILAGARITHLTARDDRGFRHQVPLFAIAGPAGFGPDQLRAYGQDAALLGQDGFPAGEWTFFDVDDLKHGSRADQLLRARRIVHARQLDRKSV